MKLEQKQKGRRAKVENFQNTFSRPQYVEIKRDAIISLHVAMLCINFFFYRSKFWG